MYSPQTDTLDFESDFEIGRFGDRLKKGFKKVAKGLDKVTEATITKPSMMIGGAIGGKKGREWGKKLGGFTSTVTKIGVGAGAAGAVAPLLASPTLHAAAITGGTAAAAHRLLKGKKRKKAKIKARKRARVKAKRSVGFKQHKCGCSNRDAANVGALLVEKLGKPLHSVNKALQLAELQRQATYEHKRLMTDGEFRQKVLAAITAMAANGDVACQRTIRVLVGR